MSEINNFLFYASFLECVENAPESERAETVYAIVHYGIYGKIPNNVPQSFKMIFPAIKPNIDSSIKRYNASVENGKKGGAPKGNQNAKKQPKNNLDLTQEQPSQNLNETKKQPKNNLDKEKEKEKDKEIEIDKEYQQQKEINKEKDFDVVDDIDEKLYFYECCSEKLNKFFFVLETETYGRIENLFSYIYKKNNFAISNEKLKSRDILSKLVYLFVGTDEEVINRFNEIFIAIDNAENINNKQNYSVSVLYQYACKL